jgi:hypothetical protein
METSDTAWMKTRRSLFVNWTRPRTLRCSTISCCLSAAFSAFKLALGLEERGNQVQEEDYQRGHGGRL